MTKLWTIARYEVLMAWRRRSLLILWLLLLIGVIGFGLLIADSNRQTPAVEDALQQNMAANAPEWAQGLDLLVSTHTIALIQVLIAGMVFYVIGVTLMMGETIPLDRQFKVRELLDTLPISRTQYLGGKLLGGWGGLLLGTLLAGVVAALALRLIIGAYDLRIFSVLWVAMLLPITFLASALSILLSSAAGSRRAAVLIGLVLMPLVMTFATLAVPSFTGVGALIEPVYAVGILLMPGDEANAEIVRRITNTLLIYGLALAITWGIAWLYARRRETR
jgi:hypothetical protein